MSIVQISNRTHLEKVVSSEDKNKLLVLYFYSNNNEQSKTINENIRQGSLKYTKETINFLFIDSSINNELISLFKVPITPYLVIVRNGYILRTMTGTELEDFVMSLDECSETILTINDSTYNLSNTQQTDSRQIKYRNDSISSIETDSTIGSDTLDEENDPEYNSDLNDSLSKLVQAVPVMIFIKGTPSDPRCRYSRQLVSLLRDNKIRFGFFDVLQNDMVRKGMKKFSDWPTFPQLYMNGEFVGGLDIIKETIKDEPEFFNNSLL
ncbi:similar to Saccharomyces cerevisiae YER174C GRX4 Hydroperoxide and superoxide-radical responsive glutathione-dependent oxidoreductase [Maudiozyma saulgeensis]|uniref:Similar to Saccharomyces cerevisiae YER174C GRX4 Hydroperoxide and superoxide-radical responsive glutathione-dependent oxidoreductase n=1 Tax=Maudiozyma saulgeensis TaxID=1789683 RepID=A0A1X7R7L1_9SACH|nr:similar to Saccharomyces cerevisiae YER174C GRX4 Hydroperoxide and superoxide-radical responsive glutathione-dependent oxidoreductase [Kazachstania saulgeensis]